MGSKTIKQIGSGRTSTDLILADSWMEGEDNAGSFKVDMVSMRDVFVGNDITSLSTAIVTVLSNEIINRYSADQSLSAAITSTGAVVYKGTWDASTNTPYLDTTSGTTGNYYIVTVSGNTNLSGITDWKVGDWAIFDIGWDKVDNTEADMLATNVTYTNSNLPLISTVQQALDSGFTYATTLTTSLSVEISDRTSGDLSLSTSILSEVSFRISVDESLSAAISSVSGNTFDIDTIMDNSEVLGMLGGELTGITYSIIVSSETSIRTSVDESLSTAISQETTGRTSTDESLSTAISQETTGRTSSDTSLSTQISTTNESLSTSISGNISSSNISLSTAISVNISTDLNSLSTSISGNISSGNDSLSNSISGNISSSDQSLSTVLSISISSEASLRSSGDTSLSISLSNKLSGLTSDLLYWNSATTSYIPYPSDIAAGTSGKFYLGNNFVSNDDLRLNYTGGFFTNALTNNGIQGSSNLAVGVMGSSNSGPGVYGVSISGYGGFFSSTTGVGGRFESFGSNALEAEGNDGVAAFIVKSATLTADDSTDLINFTRITDGGGLYSISGDIINIVDDPTNATYISGSTIKATIGMDIRIDMNPRVANSGTSIAYMFDTDTSLTESGAKLLELRNSGITKFYVDLSGNTISSNTRKISLIFLTSGGTTIWDMNSSCSAKVILNGATTLDVSGTTSGDNGTLIVIQNGVGTFTFPTNSKYAGGTPLTLSGGGQLDILSFYFDGTNYYWNIGKNYA